MGTPIALDRYDFKILAHLQQEGRCSNVELAEAVGLSQSPCLVRTKRLQEIGVICGFGADIALEKLGEYITVFSEVTLVQRRRQHFNKFEQVAGQHVEIVECYNISGGYDYLLKIVAPSVGYFYRLMEQLLDADIGIEKFASRIVLRQPFGKRKYPISIIAMERNLQ